jgi:HAD superfamily hydrolase (TIGR01662 family)
LTLKAVLTDMDGTIARFNLDYMSMRRTALRLLQQAGLSPPSFSDQMSIHVMMKELRLTISSDRYNEIKQRIYDAIDEIEIDSAKDAQLTSGAKEALKKLKQMKKKLVVVTNNGRLGTERTLERLGVTGMFDGVVTRDHADELKPDPEMVLKALDVAGANPDEAILVGDSIIDIKAAGAVGVRSVAVPTGPFSLARLLEEGPDFIITSFLDLPGLVRRLDNEA